ncbi:unnamed protein product [Thelazia callipaeda]|uniref:Membrane transporter protein n=1 Tax=Thelazia callipaeda TaxID=103827 RepID=A0A0N5D428_THECL|nr:unnamed protein product [Thelazia callipaeda]
MSSGALDTIIELASQYKSEFETTFYELKKRAAILSKSTGKEKTFDHFVAIHEKLKKHRDEIIATIRDTQTALPELDTTKLMSTFAWMAVVLLGSSLGAIFGGIVLPPLIGFFLMTSDAALMAYVILPLATYYFLQLPMESSLQNDLLRRHVLFTFGAVEGFLTGYIFANKDLIGTPPIAALTPVAIGIIPHLGSSVIGQDRSKLIWLTIGGGFILHLSLGTIIELSLPYLLLTALYGLIGFAILQLYVSNVQKEFVSFLF